MCSETLFGCVQYAGKASIMAPTADGIHTAMCQASDICDNVICMSSRRVVPSSILDCTSGVFPLHVPFRLCRHELEKYLHLRLEKAVVSNRH